MSADMHTAETCIACDIAFKEGDRVLHDVSGGSLHFDCCSPDSYVNLETGDPLPPGDVPEPHIWSVDKTEEKPSAAEIAKRALEFYRDAWSAAPAKGRFTPGLEWTPTSDLLEDCGNRAEDALTAISLATGGADAE
jgi:hypothetical protein